MIHVLNGIGQVVQIQYTDADDAEDLFESACEARGSSISIILRDPDVVKSGSKKYHYEEC